MTDFSTKLDSSNNRQLKQFRDTTTILSGTTQFGIPDAFISFTGNTINVDALQYIQSRGYILVNDPITKLTGVSTVLTRDTDGVIVNTPITGFTIGGGGTDYVTGGTFNTSTGDLTLTRISGGTVITNLDGRYLTGATAAIIQQDDGNGIGYVIKDRNPAYFNPVGLGSMDLSSATSAGGFGAESPGGFTTGADNLLLSGASNFGAHQAHGYGNTVQGYYGNMAFGAYNTVTDGYNFVTMGYTNTANMKTTVGHGMSVGAFNDSSEYWNNAFGFRIIAKTKGITAVGVANTDYPEGVLDADRPSFVVGIGDASSVAGAGYGNVAFRKDGFIVRFDGTVQAPELTNAIIGAESTGKVIITREYLEAYNPINAQKNINGNYTILSGDNNTLLVLSSATAFNITVNSGLTNNFETEFINIGTSTVTFLTSGTANLTYPDGTIFLPNKVAFLVKIGSTNNYWLKGELE